MFPGESILGQCILFDLVKTFYVVRFLSLKLSELIVFREQFLS